MERNVNNDNFINAEKMERNVTNDIISLMQKYYRERGKEIKTVVFIFVSYISKNVMLSHIPSDISLSV